MKTSLHIFEGQLILYEQLLMFRYFVTTKKGVRQSNSDLISFNIIISPTAITQNSSNELHQPDMYSQLLKEPLEIEYDENVKDEFVHLFHIQYGNNQKDLEISAEFQKYYPRETNVHLYDHIGEILSIIIFRNC
jgi:hypothetical protein